LSEHKCNRILCHTSTNSRSACQGEHMEWHGSIFTKVPLAKNGWHYPQGSHSPTLLYVAVKNFAVFTFWRHIVFSVHHSCNRTSRCTD